MRIVAYVRVSTEEQRKFGISIDSQLSAIREWAQKNGHTIIKEYNDAGVSGRQPISKRKQLSLLLSDLEYLRPDAVVFHRLDRWFRSVKEYYKAQEILDKYGVSWIAIGEDYETVTAGGRFKVNIMLAVAEQEAARGAERVKSVFEHKIAMGEWVAPQGLPLGYSIEDKRLVPNDDAPAVLAAFQRYAETHSQYDTIDFLRDSCGISVLRMPLRRMLQNHLYLGEYRNNLAFCDPIVPRELFDLVQEILQKRTVRHNQSGRVYLFSGLCRCASCGWALGGMTSKRNGREYHNYRCNKAWLNHQCTNKRFVSEKKLEGYLLDHIQPEMDRLIAETKVEYQPKKSRKKKQPANIQAKLDRLKDLYVDGLIDKDQYLSDRDRLFGELQGERSQQQPPNYAALYDLMGKDFRSRYDGLDRADKRTLWRSLLDRIVIDEDGNISFYFSP